MELLTPGIGLGIWLITLLLVNLALLIVSCGFIVFKKDMDSGQKIVLLIVSFLLPVIGPAFALIAVTTTKSGK
jgi:hypothetical protein